jgi:hypothetical protein
VRAESIDLRVLIDHRAATQASGSLESVADIFMMRALMLQCAHRSSGIATINVVEYD